MTCRGFRLRRASPGRRQPRPQDSAGCCCVPPMAPAPNPGPSAAVAAAGVASVGIWRLLAVAAPHLAALAIMLQTETDFGSRAGFLLSWGILNFFWIALLRRPALSGALSLTLVVVLVLLSRLKHDIVQMTANFVDLMVIDRDTAAFLFTIFPQSALVGDRRRVRRHAPDVRAVVARSVPHPPSAGGGLRAGLSRRAGRLCLRLAGRSLARLLRRRLSVEILPLRRHRRVGFHPLRFHGIRRRGRPSISRCRWWIPAIPPGGGRTSS